METGESLREAGGSASVRDREPALDALRGLALFGILVVNLPFFAAPEFVAAGWLSRAFLGAVDTTAAFVVQAAFAGKFISIFSLLFGFGAARQLQESGAARFRRRLGALALLGLAHALLLFLGDILVTYALLGLVLPRAVRWSTRTLVRTAVLLWVVSVALSGCLGALQAFGPPLDPADAEPLIALHRSGDFMAIAANRLSEFLPLLAGGLVVGTPQVLGLMLLGIVGYRRLGDRPLAEALDAGARTARFLWLPALGGNLLYAAAATGGVSGGSQAAAGLAAPLLAIFAPLLALAIVGTLLPLLAGPRSGGIAARTLAVGGRLSLSVYIAQSVVCGLIFDGYGLGLYGSVGPAGCLGLAVLVYAALLWLATLWSWVAGQGPLERLVARMTGPRLVPRPVDGR